VGQAVITAGARLRPPKAVLRMESESGIFIGSATSAGGGMSFEDEAREIFDDDHEALRAEIKRLANILRGFGTKESYIEKLLPMSWLTRIQPEDPHKRARCLRCGAALTISLAEEDIMMHCENCGEIHDSMRVLSEESEG